MAVTVAQRSINTDIGDGNTWETVLEITKAAQAKNSDPFLWAMQLGAFLDSAGKTVPSFELARLLISDLCWENNVPSAWKFLEKAISSMLVPPILTLALLADRVVPARHCYPAAYRLYLELLKRHGFSFSLQMDPSTYEGVLHSIDDALHLSQTFGVQSSEPGVLVVILVLSIVWQLLDASLDDEGLLQFIHHKKSRWSTRMQDMEIDNSESFEKKRADHHVAMRRMNTSMAVEIIGVYLQDKVTSRVLSLAKQYMSSDWSEFVDCLSLLASKSSTIRNLKCMTPDTLLRFTSGACEVLAPENKTSLQQELHGVMASRSPKPSVYQIHGTTHSALWIPIDLFLEDAMEGLNVTARSAVNTLTDTVKSLQAVNCTTWCDAFLGLWIAALRIVQRERNCSEGPIPRLDTCLCMLLSITTLSIANIIEEEENAAATKETECMSPSHSEDKFVVGKRRSELISSLQLLREYEGLLTPPPSVIPVANQAAAKAMMFLPGISTGSGCLECVSMNDLPLNYSGTMLHLIVEACIARDVLDTSAYTWPGYVNACSNQMPCNAAGHIPGWSSLMKGAPLSPTIGNVLISTPASSLTEIERIFEIAVGGSTDEKLYAAMVLCGASLVRGWNFQEHVALMVTRLLSPPKHANFSGSENHLLNHASLLNILLIGISTTDVIQIFSLHGLVPQLAGALIPICEVFGSCSPKESWILATGEEINSYAVFSNAFTLLLKLWRFDHPALEDAVLGPVLPVEGQLTPEYLLVVRNSQLAESDQSRNKMFTKLLCPPTEPIFMDSFPKLKRWYMQHQACIVSTLSGLNQGNPVHEIIEWLSSMMFRKSNKGAPSTNGSSSSSLSATEEVNLRLQFPAWDILEAVPFVLDAALTACAHDKLSPRELATGLKDLADFLPASLAGIISYLAAEVSRGVWKPAVMNGTDWPSPAANLASVEQQIKKLLADTGIDIPSLATARNTTPTLPLPLAALLSLTITYKIDKASERFLNLVGRSVVTLATECPWPCMPIVSSLWVQKAKRWSDYLVFNASRTVFHHNSDTVVQLLRTIFWTTLGLTPSPRKCSSGVGALLGHGFSSHQSASGISPCAPGIFYLQIYPFIKDIVNLTEEILSLLVTSVKEIVGKKHHHESTQKLKTSKYAGRYRQVSITAAMTRVKLAASLGASLVWITGGLGLVLTLLRQILPSWFITDHSGDPSSGGGELVAMLRGYALAYFTMMSGALALGTDMKASTAASDRGPQVIRKHLMFMAMAADGKISLGCEWATWRAYVSGFVSLMVGCAPAWVREVDVDVLKSLSNGLRQWGEEDLALALLGSGGIAASTSAVEMIIGCRLTR
ncbi:hypothetical protein V2J09_009188 [Rumex salicifolius]